MTRPPAKINGQQPTALQEAFARNWMLTRNPLTAFKLSTDARRLDARECELQARKLMGSTVVKKRIRQLLADDAAEDRATLGSVFRWLIEVVHADPNEVVQHRVGCCRHCWGVAHAYQWTLNEYLAATAEVEAENARAKTGARLLNLPDCSGGFGYDQELAPALDCPECFGRGRGYVWIADTRDLSPGALALYAGVQQTKDGLKVLFADKMKAAEMAIRMMGGFQDNSNVRLTGELKALVGVVDARTQQIDPAKGAELYAAMIKDSAMRLTGPSNRGK